MRSVVPKEHEMQPQIKKVVRQNQQLERRSWRSWGTLSGLLWLLWTAAVVTTGYLSWHSDVSAQRPFSVLGLVVHCGVVGMIGLVVLTLVEMRLEPWRFLDE